MLVVNLFKSVVNFLSAPQYLVTAMLVLVLAAIHWRPLWSKIGGIVLFSALAAGIGLSYLDPNFAAVATLPDNVPIVGMIFLVGFFFWYAMHHAYENDRRVAAGLPTIEGEDSAQKVFSWPDLVYVELICLVIVMAVLIVWSIALKAPLEEPANPTDSPNPAKAPWYFLGLQEMLVYYDPWLAGVVLPSLIIVGLMAIPYIDTNPKGNGYFTFKERHWEITIFLVGFIVLWCSLIALGTFLGRQQTRAFEQHQSVRDHVDQGVQEVVAQLLADARDLRPRSRRLLHRRAAVGSLSDASAALLRENGDGALHDRRQPRVDHAFASDQDVLALDLQPEIHRGDPRDRVQHLRTLRDAA
jgi:Cytochrome b(C-terminal)/b6/petD